MTDITELVLAVIIIPLVGLNVYVCCLIGKSDAPNDKKVAQCLFVWCLPVIGAIVALAVFKPSSTVAPLGDVGIADGMSMPGQINYDRDS